MANQQLIDYFKKGLEKNIPLIYLKQELIRHGWPQQLVEEAANEISKAEITETPIPTILPNIQNIQDLTTAETKKEVEIEAPKISKGEHSLILKISAIVFLFLIIATSGTFLYSKFISKEVKIQPKETLVVETTKIVSEEAEEIDLANLPKQVTQVSEQQALLQTSECNFNLNCDDQNPCTNEMVNNLTCPTNCIYNETISCINNDRCCPVNCDFNNDNDCSATCGNSFVDANEKCDNNCPSSCNDNYACTRDNLIGNASTCTAECTFIPITSCINNDGCCPSGCGNANDNDCLAQQQQTQQNVTQPTLQTCQAQNGFICNENEICAQSFIQASDTDRCCPIACSSQVSESPAPEAPPPLGLPGAPVGP